jgi:hypothetical protein
MLKHVSAMRLDWGRISHIPNLNQITVHLIQIRSLSKEFNKAGSLSQLRTFSLHGLLNASVSSGV